MASDSVLVTGGAGFIGSHVVRSILSDLPDVDRLVVVDDLSGGYQDNLPADARVEFHRLSVLDADAIDELFAEHRFGHVYHLAAYAAEGLSHFIRRFNYENNVIGSVNVLNAALKYGCECFVFTSSIAVYGRAQTPMTEATVPQPEDPYGVAKYAVELDLRAAHEMFGIDFVVFRPHNVYGEYQNIADKYRNVVGIFMNQILRDEPLTIFGDGEQQRAFTYVGDVAPIIAQAPRVEAARNQVFNVGADTPMTVNDLAVAVTKALGVPGHPIRHLPARKEVKDAYSSHVKCGQVFGLPEATPLADGLERMAMWAKSIGARSSRPFEPIEITRKLPPSWQPSQRQSPMPAPVAVR